MYALMSSKRKTFVLKCDKPRYDGGVEIDLKQYFGDRFQSDALELKALAQSQLSPAQRSGLGKDMLTSGMQFMEVPHYVLEDDAVSPLQALHHADEIGLENRVSAAWEAQAAEHTLTTVPSAQSLHVEEHKAVTSAGKATRFKTLLLEGPIQLLIACAGLGTACLALCSLALLSNPEGIAKQSYALIKSCHTLLLKGLINTLLFPIKTLHVIK
jgi:hypothetical protein